MCDILVMEVYMPKVVVNACFGGFGLSDKAISRYSELKGINLVPISDTNLSGRLHWYIDGIEDNDHYFYDGDLDRTDPFLVQVVEELGYEANGNCARLRVADVPDDVNWYIDDYDGRETVREISRSW